MTLLKIMFFIFFSLCTTKLFSYQCQEREKVYKEYSMNEMYYLEKIDPKHRYGKYTLNLLTLYKLEYPSERLDSFFSWLDLNHPHLPQVEYLSKEETRKYYLNTFESPRTLRTSSHQILPAARYIFVMDNKGDF